MAVLSPHRTHTRIWHAAFSVYRKPVDNARIHMARNHLPIHITFMNIYYYSLNVCVHEPLSKTVAPYAWAVITIWVRCGAPFATIFSGCKYTSILLMMNIMKLINHSTRATLMLRKSRYRNQCDTFIEHNPLLCSSCAASWHSILCADVTEKNQIGRRDEQNQ